MGGAFPGSAEFMSQVPGICVAALDDIGSLSLRPTGGRPAPSGRLTPVEVYFDPGDSYWREVVFFVRDGWLDEMVVINYNETPSTRPPWEVDTFYYDPPLRDE